MDLRTERKSLRKEIGRIAEDYNDHGKGGKGDRESDEHDDDKRREDSGEDGELQRATKGRDPEEEAGKREGIKADRDEKAREF